MSGLRQLNLYDAGLRRKRDRLALGNIVAGGAILLAGVVFAGFAARSEIDGLKAQAASVETQTKALRDQLTLLGQKVAGQKIDPQIELDIAAAQVLLDARGEVLKSLQKQAGAGASAYSDYLRGLARQNLNGLRLAGFAYRGADGGMEIRGQTLNPALIPEYIRRLNKEPAFQGRAFSALKLSESKPEAASEEAKKAPAARTPGIHEFTLIPLNPAPGEKGTNPDAR